MLTASGPSTVCLEDRRRACVNAETWLGGGGVCVAAELSDVLVPMSAHM